jgi:23S rRNA (uracil1939-C5)-methyltransferase
MRRRQRTKAERRVRAETVELTVESLGAQGDGIAHSRGEPVFLPFTVPGDRVRAEIGARRGPGVEARVIERIVTGPRRAVPACRHFGYCGGCSLQHLAAEDYQAVKLGALNEALRRVGIDPALVEPLRTLPPTRRRVRLGLSRAPGGDAPVVVGFRERFRHVLVDLHECLVLEPVLFALIEPLRRIAVELLAPGAEAEAMLTRCDSGIDLLIEHERPPDLAALEVLGRLAADCDLARIVWRTGRDDMLVVERRPVRIVFAGVSVPFPPGGFLQASAAAERVLVDEVVGAIGKQGPVLDLYAGLGTFTFALGRAGAVHAVEGDAAAVIALTQAAAHLPRVTVERRDLNREPLTISELNRHAAAVFDPPRAGALRQTAALADSTLETVVAVSCNPATFARDAARLIAGGFRLERVVPIDQFAWTPHLELVATFRR